MRGKLLETLDELFELDPGSIQATDEIRQIPGWSSLSFMTLLAMIDEDFGVLLTPKEFSECSTVSDLLELVAGKAATRQAA